MSRDHMEPQVAKTVDSSEAIALTSIAISLKRIADLLEGNPKRFGLIDAITDLTNEVRAK